MMSEYNELHEKKLRGSGGYVFARVTDEEQKRGNLGGPELFLAGLGRLEEDRFLKYYCNKCEREYEGSPAVNYENPNEELGEGVTLVEKGEYKCGTCNNTIAQYRKFGTSSTPQTKTTDPSATMQLQSSELDKIETPSITSLQQSTAVTSTKTATSGTQGGFIPIQSVVGMPAYDSEALLVGKVQEIGLRKSAVGNVQLSIKISKEDNDDGTELLWNNISKIGDIVLLSSRAEAETKNAESAINGSGKCPSCNYQNEDDAIFCEECGTKLLASGSK
jgi:sporulation protein YlmC with PRC-barrel domain/DNA-directed RNA polymerase subunit RPC12/RpoP